MKGFASSTLAALVLATAAFLTFAPPMIAFTVTVFGAATWCRWLDGQCAR